MNTHTVATGAASCGPIRHRVCLLDANAQLGDSVTLRFPRGVTMQGTVIEMRHRTLLVQIGEGQHVAVHEVGR